MKREMAPIIDVEIMLTFPYFSTDAIIQPSPNEISHENSQVSLVPSPSLSELDLFPSTSLRSSTVENGTLGPESGIVINEVSTQKASSAQQVSIESSVTEEKRVDVFEIAVNTLVFEITDEKVKQVLLKTKQVFVGYEFLAIPPEELESKSIAMSSESGILDINLRKCNQN